MSSSCIRSLCIFDHETHPNMHQKHAKESLSLFGTHYYDNQNVYTATYNSV